MIILGMQPISWGSGIASRRAAITPYTYENVCTPDSPPLAAMCYAKMLLARPLQIYAERAIVRLIRGSTLYVPQGSGIVYITIAQAIRRGSSIASRRARHVGISQDRSDCATM